MAELFDHICRILATPMPRSRALKLIVGGLAGTALAPFAFGDSCAPGDPRTCPPGNTGQCCPGGQQCCVRRPNGNSACCRGGQICCPPFPNATTCCSSTQVCVDGACQKPTQTQP